MRLRTAVAATAFAASAVLGGASAAVADSGAQGTAANSPGVISGNQAQIPVHVPVNACGNTVDIIGVLNPASNNGCAND